MNWPYILISVCLVSFISFIGALTLAVKSSFLNKVLIYFVAFSAGALIGDSFIHLLPEAVEDGFTISVSISIFCGLILFFILEKFLRWRHCHEINCHDHPKHIGSMNLVGDAVHNFLDGIIIASSFIVSVPLGIATTLAVVLHEIPQELGDFGVLLHSGFTKKRALFFNFISACFAIIGAVLAIFLEKYLSTFSFYAIPFTTGGFLYIALSDLIPELHKEVKWQQSLLQLLFIFMGLGIMYLLLFFEK